MAEQPNPFEILEGINRAMYGDPAARSQGLFDKIDALNHKLDRTDEKLERIESRKPSVANWTAGYISFCAGGIFAVIAILNQVPKNQILNIPGEMAAIIAVVLAAIALYFFLTGFGWVGHNN